MVSVVEQRVRKQVTASLYNTIISILQEKKIEADVSYKVCREIVVHYRRDAERLYVTHHLKVHPTKHCSYLAFWIRKLKPISRAYPLASVANAAGIRPLDDEATDINERVALFCAVRWLHDYIEAGFVPLPPGGEWVRRFDETAEKYLSGQVEEELSMGNRFGSIVYDLRYRTFGPHHLTHTLTHILMETVYGPQAQ